MRGDCNRLHFYNVIMKTNILNYEDKFIILADDLTGALDSGVQLAQGGMKVLITLDREDPLLRIDGADVLVIDTETRHIASESAYKIIYDIVRKMKEYGVHTIYKKTDSGLRGNVGAELSALSDAYENQQIRFVPAWPKMNRVTRNAIHYVNGLPLSESIFAKDVLDPVRHSNINELIGEQSDISLSLYPDESGRIVLYDCDNDAKMEDIAEDIFAQGDEIRLIAGCAGLLEKYPSDGKQHIQGSDELPHKLLVLSGSMNEVTARQLKHAEEDGAMRLHLSVNDIATGSFSDESISEICNRVEEANAKDIIIIDSMSELDVDVASKNDLSNKISLAMGNLAEKITKREKERTLMVIGGDTLLGIVSKLNIETLEPIREIESGIVLSRYSIGNDIGYLISKSGAFGSEDLLIQIEKYLSKEDK